MLFGPLCLREWLLAADTVFAIMLNHFHVGAGSQCFHDEGQGLVLSELLKGVEMLD